MILTVIYEADAAKTVMVGFTVRAQTSTTDRYNNAADGYINATDHYATTSIQYAQKVA